MKNTLKKIYNVLIIFLINLIFINKFVYADVIDSRNQIKEYSPSYYIVLVGAIVVIVGFSVLILRSIYKSNNIEKEDEKGDEQ